MANKVPTGYIVDVETNERVEFFAWNPFSNQVSAVYAKDPIRGRSTPQIGWVQTGEDDWSCSIFLHTAARILDPSADSRSLQDQANFIKSFNYPDYGENLDVSRAVRPPHRCMVIRGEFKVIGYIDGYSYQEQQPYDVTGLPMVAEVTFNLHRLPAKPLGLRDVREWWRL